MNEAYRAASCEGKQSFDRATANRVVRDHNRMLKGCEKRGAKARRRTSVIAFRCRYCGHWHIGSPPRSRK